jgi:uncharacterized protein YbcI
MKPSSAHQLARQVAHATGTFEHLLTGRSPTAVTVVGDGDWLVVSFHQPLAPVEKRVAADPSGAQRVRAVHEYLFEHSLDALVGHVRHRTGVELRGAICHVDMSTGSVFKTFTTRPDVDLFLLGRGLPALGVPVNAHRHANGFSPATHAIHADGIGAGRD